MISQGFPLYAVETPADPDEGHDVCAVVGWIEPAWADPEDGIRVPILANLDSGGRAEEWRSDPDRVTRLYYFMSVPEAREFIEGVEK